MKTLSAFQGYVAAISLLSGGFQDSSSDRGMNTKREGVKDSIQRIVSEASIKRGYISRGRDIQNEIDIQRKNLKIGLKPLLLSQSDVRILGQLYEYSQSYPKITYDTIRDIALEMSSIQEMTDNKNRLDTQKRLYARIEKILSK